MAMTRRGFLGLSAGGAALLALGGVGVALQPTVARTSAVALRALTPRQFSVLAAFADRACPGGDGFPTAAEVQVAEKVDGLLATMHPADAAELGQALLLFDNALVGLLMDGRLATFSAAAPDVQDATIMAWRTSKIATRRQVYKAIRGLVAASYYASPETYAAVGYPGPPDFSTWVAPGAGDEEPVDGAVPDEVVP